MNFEEIKEKYIKVCTLKVEVGSDASLKERINSLNDEGLIELYNFYDLTEDNSLYKSKQGKKNYLIREIPSQFLDDFSFMMNRDDRKILEKICQNESPKINAPIVHFMNFGYVYMTPNGKLILPVELKRFVEDLFCNILIENK